MERRPFSIDDPSAAPYLAAYFPLGDPLVPQARLAAYFAADVDVIELGLRTANPYADGKVIAASMRRSTGAGTLADVNSANTTLQHCGRPIMGMVFAYASDSLTDSNGDWAGIDALLCLGKGQLRDGIEARAVAAGARLTAFVPHDLPAPDIDRATVATGFVFLQYTAGPTGLREAIDPLLKVRVARLRAAGVTAPILTGIGLSTPDQARHALAAGANGIVIGSKTVQKAIEGQTALEDYLGEMRAVLNGS
jgi:tryptophan synthase alpha chain